MTLRGFVLGCILLGGAGSSAQASNSYRIQPPDYTLAEFDSLHQVHVRGTFLVTRAIGRFFGAPPTIPMDKVIDLKGYPGSPGVVRGTARVIMSISEGSRLNKGEILVAPTTAPPWTPLFATAGGIVTDTGGVLSHCAIVAREYGIPAAVGIYGATTAIKDGMTIEVDGNEGVVRILS